jgi:hypothetical protein
MGSNLSDEAKQEAIEAMSSGSSTTVQDQFLGLLGQVNGLANSVTAGATSAATTLNAVNDARYAWAALANPAMGMQAKLAQQTYHAQLALNKAQFEAQAKINHAQFNAEQSRLQIQADQPAWMHSGGFGLSTAPMPTESKSWTDSPAVRLTAGAVLVGGAVVGGVALGKALAARGSDEEAFSGDVIDIDTARASFG